MVKRLPGMNGAIGPALGPPKNKQTNKQTKPDQELILPEDHKHSWEGFSQTQEHLQRLPLNSAADRLVKETRLDEEKRSQ